MEVLSQSSEALQKPARTGCLSEIGWFFSGAVLPLGSLTFYRRATRRPAGLAILFFFVFTIFISALNTTSIGISMAGLSRNIRQAFADGTVPSLTITHGIAQATGKQPFVWTSESTQDGPMFVAIDTTGQITSIDRSRYRQGFLLTKNNLVILDNTGQYQHLPLYEFNSLFGQDPLLINAETVSSAWRILALVFAVVFFIVLVLWNSIARLMFIALVALIVWGIASLFHSKAGFEAFIVTGIYAVVPAVYLAHLLDRIGLAFVGLQTLLLFAFWTAALVAALTGTGFFRADAPERLWTAWLGLPLLGLLGADVFVNGPSIYWKVALWAVALLTGLLLVAVRLVYHWRDLHPAEPPILPPGGLA